MKTRHLLSLFLCLAFTVSGQELYVNIGDNISNYTYENSIGEQSMNSISGKGSSYGLGVTFPIIKPDSTFTYGVGVAFNEFNAQAIELNASATEYFYSELMTSYLGLHQELNYHFHSPFKNFVLRLNASVNLNTLISGREIRNLKGVQPQFLLNDNLAENPLYAGIFIEPGVGAGFQYSLDHNICFSLDYTYSRNYKLKTIEEKFTFKNHRLRVQIKFPLHK
jgi:opacity protein-like surface antigen